MSAICKSCRQPLVPNSNACSYCGAKIQSRWNWGPPEKKSDVSPPETDSSSEAVVNTDLHVEQAMKFIEANDFDAALLSLNRAIVDATPDRLAECFALRGYAQLKLGKFRNAETDCTEAIGRSLADSQTFAWRAAAYGEQNRWPEAFDDLAQAHENAGDNADEYLALMDSYAEAASEHYRELIKRKEETAQTFFDRGWVYFRAGKSDKATRDFKLALEMDPTHGRAAMGLAGLSLEAGQYEDTLQHCQAAMAADPSCEKELLPIRIKAYHALDDRTSALKDLKHLKKLSIADIAQLLEIAQLRLSLGEHIRAISDLTAILKLDPNSAHAIKLRADAYLTIRNHALAIRDYSRYLRHHSDSLQVRISRGTAFLNDNQIEAAIADFDRALELNNLSPDAFLGRSKALIKAGDMQAALTECERACRLNNSQADVFGTLAEIYYSLCDYTRSIEEFSRAARLSAAPEEEATYIYRRGNAKYELNQLDDAASDFQTATELNPNHAGAWIWTAAVAARTENWPDVVNGLENAIRANPAAAQQYQTLGKPVARKAVEHFGERIQNGERSADVHKNRGLANLFLGNHLAAVEDFDRATETEPKNNATRLQRGRALCLVGRHAEAIAELTQVIKADRADHRARYYRAASRLAVGDTSKAAVDAMKASKITPNQSRYHLLHGEIMQVAQRWKHAIKCLDRAITTDPNDPIPYRRRAAIFSQTGQHLRAISDLNTAHGLNPQNIEVLVARGNAYNKAEEFELAQQDFELALTHDNTFASAYAGRGFALAGLDQYDNALIWLTKAIHRFIDRRELSSILFMRGKIYYRMGRYEHAINDFTCTLLLVRDSRITTAAVLTARAAAYAQNNMWKFAEDDLVNVIELQPNNQSLRRAHQWVVSGNHNTDRPALFTAPETLVRPIRPPTVCEPTLHETEINQHLQQYDSVAPYDGWIVKSVDGKEYGPATLQTIAVWLREGRLSAGMQLLRSDWSQWKLVEKIVPAIVPTEQSISDFPELKLEIDLPVVDDQQN